MFQKQGLEQERHSLRRQLEDLEDSWQVIVEDEDIFLRDINR